MKRTLLTMIAAVTLCFLVLMTGVLAFAVQRSQPNAARQWQSSEMIQPLELFVQIRNNGPGKPLIISVAFPALYRAGHIPGAVFGGPASTPAGLDALKRAVEKVPKDREIVIYCGCCPWEACPNVRPAFDLLHQLGYSRVKSLVIPSNLEADWTAKGYPLDKGQ
jgi:thiosulfate/3-mercaptopyruvate sulfurtransferase